MIYFEKIFKSHTEACKTTQIITQYKGFVYLLLKLLARVVRKEGNAIYPINRYPADLFC